MGLNEASSAAISRRLSSGVITPAVILWQSTRHLVAEIQRGLLVSTRWIASAAAVRCRRRNRRGRRRRRAGRCPLAERGSGCWPVQGMAASLVRAPSVTSRRCCPREALSSDRLLRLWADGSRYRIQRLGSSGLCCWFLLGSRGHEERGEVYCLALV